MLDCMSRARKETTMNSDVLQPRSQAVESVGARSIRLRGKSWFPPGMARAVVIIAHGKDEHIGRYLHVFNELVAHGYAVYGHDHRGHGQSEGPRGVITRFDDYVDDLDLLISQVRNEHVNLPIVLLGHSMGGLIAARYALLHQQKLSALVLSGPALLIGENAPWWQTRPLLLFGRFFPDRPMPSSEPAVLSRDREVNRLFAADPLCNNTPTKTGFVRQLYLASEATRPRGSEITLPILLMHGEADQLTSPRGSQTWYESATSADKTLKTWTNAHHEIFNELNKDEVITYMLTWLDARFPA
jgi:acylglycerol lipase